MQNVNEFSNRKKEDKLVYNILEKILVSLNECQKGLNEFIAKKRKVFP
jgi:hypothetical protein